MIEERLLHLIHRAADDALSERERVELDRRLQDSPETRRLYDQILGLKDLVSAAPSVDPPAALKSRILAQIDPARYRRRATGSRTIGTWIGHLWTPQLAYGLAAGLILGIGVASLTHNAGVDPLNPRDLSGTILRQQPSTLSRIDADAFTTDQATGQLAVDAGNGLTYVQIALESSLEVAVVLEFDESALVARAYEQQQPQAGSITSAPGRITATHMGQNRYLFVLGQIADTDRPLVCRIESTGQIYQREVHLPRQSD